MSYHGHYILTVHAAKPRSLVYFITKYYHHASALTLLIIYHILNMQLQSGIQTCSTTFSNLKCTDICDRVRKNQAFVKKIRFSDYCRIRSGLSVRVVLQNLKPIAPVRLPSYGYFFPQRDHETGRFRRSEAFPYSWSVELCNDYACGSKVT